MLKQAIHILTILLLKVSCCVGVELFPVIHMANNITCSTQLDVADRRTRQMMLTFAQQILIVIRIVRYLQFLNNFCEHYLYTVCYQGTWQYSRVVQATGLCGVLVKSLVSYSGTPDSNRTHDAEISVCFLIPSRK
jgi:hypothetical protein